MTNSDHSAAAPVESDFIWWPIWHGWIIVAFSLFFAVVGFACIALAAWILLRPGPSGPFPGLVFLFGGMGLFILVLGFVFFRFGWWQIKDRPRWVIGPDGLRFMDGVSRVRVYIPYTNLASVEICRPRRGAARFIGFRLVHPEVFKIYAGLRPLRARKLHQHFGYDECIGQAETDLPLGVVLEMIQGRFLQWQAASSSLASPSAVSPVTDITSCPSVQEDFTKKPL
jgi:hypothetical protein